ncbi:maleylpyruvate isomerase N-terminal domain-containing protein [Streptomyces inhibens]|uniref:maleylpyruvate isomerase N-terminal domain-containing protein n=1 Tax=Streptomyces inhibens TaxID=2293571 RepID=UPI003CC82AF8
MARDVAALVAAVRPADLDLPTPCAGWSARPRPARVPPTGWRPFSAASRADPPPTHDRRAGGAPPALL